MKNKNFKLLLLSLPLFGVILASISITSAWFIVNTRVTVRPSDNVQIVTKGQDLQVANYGDDLWGSVLDRSASDILASTDISGNGEHLYFPKRLNRSDDKPIMDSFIEVTSDAQFDSTYYVDYKISFKTSFKMDVFLEETSTISPKEEVFGALNTMQRKSSFGNFSADAIAGAVRVAFLELDDEGNSTLKNVWVPNDKYQLSYSGGTSAELKLNGKRENKYSYVTFDEEQGYIIKDYTSDDIAYGRLTLGDVGQLAHLDEVTGEVTINNACPLLSFRDSTEEVIKHMIIRIWIEGTDREADKALAGGRFDYNFQFVGVLKDPNPNTIVTLDKPYVYNDDAKSLYVVNDATSDSTQEGPFVYYTRGVNFTEYDMGLNVSLETPTMQLRNRNGSKTVTYTRYTGNNSYSDYIEETPSYSSSYVYEPDRWVIFQKNDKKLYRLGETEPLKDGLIEYSINGIDWYKYDEHAFTSEEELALTDLTIRYSETRYIRCSDRFTIKINQTDGEHLYGVC